MFLTSILDQTQDKDTPKIDNRQIVDIENLIDEKYPKTLLKQTILEDDVDTEVEIDVKNR
jgi:hypothetical protein